MVVDIFVGVIGLHVLALLLVIVAVGLYCLASASVSTRGLSVVAAASS